MWNFIKSILIKLARIFSGSVKRSTYKIALDLIDVAKKEISKNSIDKDAKFVADTALKLIENFPESEKKGFIDKVNANNKELKDVTLGYNQKLGVSVDFRGVHLNYNPNDGGVGFKFRGDL